ncbi:hypothetical protein AURDEDRAFT_188096 [Auricularia subglabra TFB-10046 SS5]|uniref:Uncharacterized protein n=1 Tax=Auricularia subglabra (strain TFB-10046 / SS5) TaxID=717982 RepID=J0LHC4_AURST|nr:hypothetical protein AURDEDRAFT_188096 [Auricularia subglabra TFB-10046 SS5]
MARFADYSDSFDEATWDAMDAVTSETESVPLTPDAQLQLLFPLDTPVSETDDPSIVQMSATSMHRLTMRTVSSSAGGFATESNANLQHARGTIAASTSAPLRPTLLPTPRSSTLHNASPVLPMPVGAATHLVPDARRATRLRRAHTDPSCSFSGTRHAPNAPHEKRRRRTESRDLHPRQDDRASSSSSARSRVRPLLVPSNATATPQLAVVPLPDVGRFDGFPSPLYQYPTPPSSPLVMPAPYVPPDEPARPPPQENRGQMVWPGIYFST